MRLTPELLSVIMNDQREERDLPEGYIRRTVETQLATLSKNKEIVMLTGIRRCGKSVLMQKIRQRNEQPNYYFNFDITDFQLLHELFIARFGMQNTSYFDEIQNIVGWERFVRRLYNSGNKIFITAFNASLFSDELGAKLTGRYVILNVFPFSFYEFASFHKGKLLENDNWSTTTIALAKKIFKQYCQLGCQSGNGCCMRQI